LCLGLLHPEKNPFILIGFESKNLGPQRNMLPQRLCSLTPIMNMQELNFKIINILDFHQNL